jgi:hypothetical protein
MKKLIFLTFPVIIFLFVACSICCAESTKLIDGVAQINSHTKNKELIKITVNTTKYSPKYPYQDGLLWGADLDVKPGSFISRIKIMIEKEQVYVPLSAYCDLAEPKMIELKTNLNSFSLIIYGGCTATSYKCELFFQNLTIKFKKIALGEFPDEVWEKIEYSFIEDSDR